MPQAGCQGRADLARPEAPPRRPSSTASSSTRPASRSSAPRSSHAGPGPQGDPPGSDQTRTGPGGTFHLDQIDPDDTLPLRARTKEATTDGTIVVTARDDPGEAHAHHRPEIRLPGPRAGHRPLGQTDRGGQGQSPVVPQLRQRASPTRWARGSAAAGIRTRPTVRLVRLPRPLAGRPVQGRRRGDRPEQGRDAGGDRQGR